MKKITLLFLLPFLCTLAHSQTKTTGVLNLNANMTAKIDLNQATSTATLTITNEASSWFGIGFSIAPTVAGNGMPGLVDVVVMRTATNFSDSRTMAGGAGNPDVDAIQNWTLQSNIVTGTTRTIVATRAFNTGDSEDYIFNYSSTSLNLIYASPGSGSFTVSYHGGLPTRGHVVAPLSVLGLEDFSLNAAQIYPNPSNGEFTIKTKISLEKINIYTHTGAFVKTIVVEAASDNVEIDIKGLQTGVYMIELVNENEKAWKKIIVN